MQNKQLQILLDCTRLITSENDWHKLAYELLEIARNTLNCEACSFSLPDSQNESLIIHSTQNHLMGHFPTLPKGQGIAWQVFESGEPVIFDPSENTHRPSLLVAQKTATPVKYMVTVPLKFQEKTLGVLQLLNPLEKSRFDSDDLEFIHSFSNLIAATLHRFLNEIQKAEEKERELLLKSAQTLAASFLPDTYFQSGGLVAKSKIFSKYECGGDFYFFERIDIDKTIIGTGDITGKGWPAALDMARVISLIKIMATDLKGLMSVTDWIMLLNSRMYEMLSKGRSCALSLAFLDNQTKKAQLCICGQPSPFIFTSNSWSQIPTPKNPPLGITPNQKFSTINIDLTDEWTFFFLTDGVTEIAPKGTDFGVSGLSNLLNKFNPVLDCFEDFVDRWRALSETSTVRDDATLMILSKLSDSESLHQRFTVSPEKISWIRDKCIEWWLKVSIPPQEAEILSLGLDEILTNIYLHALDSHPKPILLNTYIQNQSVFIDVEHEGLPLISRNNSMPKISQPHGRGLHVIEQIFDTIKLKTIRAPWLISYSRQLSFIS